jgi:predicted transposase/invertase (TIGR01784 family)
LKAQHPNLHYWIDFFLEGEVGEDAPSYLEEAIRMIENKSWSKEEKEIISSAKKADQLVEEYIWSAHEDGVEQGIEQEKIETAKTLCELGSDLEFISKVTKIPVEELKKILK